MKNLLLIIFLLIAGLIEGQDVAGNRAFPRFLNNSTSFIRSIVDENGIETIVAFVSGQIVINDSTKNLTNAALLMMRHNIRDSANFTYSFLSDPTKPFTFSSGFELYLTKKGVGLMISFNTSPVNLRNITIPLKYTFNTVFAEYDSALNLVDYTKFGSNGTFNMLEFSADKNGNKYVMASYSRELKLNDSSFFFSNGPVRNGIFCFNKNKISWANVFDTVNIQSFGALQVATRNNKLYLLMSVFGKNINYKGHLLARTGNRACSLLQLDTSGNYLNDIETDSIFQINASNTHILLSDERVFLNISFFNFIKLGELIIKPKQGNLRSAICELDTSLRILNFINLEYEANNTAVTLKAFAEDKKLLYMELVPPIVSSPSIPTALLINDSLKSYKNFKSYPDLNYTRTLYSYSMEKKMLISAYDMTGMQPPIFFNVYCPEGEQKVYCNLSFYNVFKVEDSLNYFFPERRNYSFNLAKPSGLVTPPMGIRAKRKAKDLVELVWINTMQYDSMHIKKYAFKFQSIEWSRSLSNAPVAYIDSSTADANANYIYEIRGYKNGECSIWTGSDSTSLTIALDLEKYLLGSILDNKSVALTWGLNKTPSNNIYYREVQRSYSRHSGFNKIADLPRFTIQYLDTTANLNVPVYYFVRDYNYMYENSTDTIMVSTKGKVKFYGNYFEIYPNPCIDQLFLALSDNEVSSATIIDACGRSQDFPLVKTTNDNYIDVSGLRNGVYVIMYDQGGNIYTKRFVKM